KQGASDFGGDSHLQQVHANAARAKGSVANEIAAYLKVADSSPGARPTPARGIQLAAAQGAGPTPARTTGGGYVGQQTCVSCHTQEAKNWAHTVHAKVFDLNPRNQLEMQGCEACHGPGSAHVQNPAEPASIVRFSRRSAQPIAEQN